MPGFEVSAQHGHDGFVCNSCGTTRNKRKREARTPAGQIMHEVAACAAKKECEWSVSPRAGDQAYEQSVTLFTPTRVVTFTRGSEGRPLPLRLAVIVEGVCVHPPLSAVESLAEASLVVAQGE